MAYEAQVLRRRPLHAALCPYTARSTACCATPSGLFCFARRIVPFMLGVACCCQRSAPRWRGGSSVSLGPVLGAMEHGVGDHGCISEDVDYYCVDKIRI